MCNASLRLLCMIEHPFTVLGNQAESLRYSCVLYLPCCSGPRINSTIRFCSSKKGKLRLRCHNSENERALSHHSKFLEVWSLPIRVSPCSVINLFPTQLYEEDARVGHREFDLKLTQRVKMSMVSQLPHWL